MEEGDLVIRVLQVTLGMGVGGIETLLMGLYRHIDRSDIQFDFLEHVGGDSTPRTCDEEIESLGGRFFRAPSAAGNPLAYRAFIADLLRQHPEYHIVHGHILNPCALIYMTETKRAGRYLIAHCHNTDEQSAGRLQATAKRACRRIAIHSANHYFACSQEAAIYGFGKRIACSGSCDVLINGIDLGPFKVDENVHIRAKRELFPACNGPLIFNDGRLERQKNQSFLLDVFSRILERCPSAELCIAGDGNLREMLEQKANDLGISERTHLIGSVNNISAYLKAADVFVFPSLFEGLGISAIEAQACGLPTLASDCIPTKAACTDLFRPMSLDESVEAWAAAVIDLWRQYDGRRADRIAQVRRAGFDIQDVADELSSFYKTIDESYTCGVSR